MSAYIDIIVKCTAAIATRLIDDMQSVVDKDAASKVWCYDLASAEQTARVIADPYARFFYKDVTGEIVAVLALAYMPTGEGFNEGRLWVANIVPRLKNKLQPDEYNVIAKQFVDLIVNPILNEKWPDLKCEMILSKDDDIEEAFSMIEDDDENAYDGRYVDFKIGISPTGVSIIHYDRIITYDIRYRQFRKSG